MKKLTWKKQLYGKDMTVWTAMVKTVGWEFTIEQADGGDFEPYLWYGQGDDIRLLPNGQFSKSLDDAKNICNTWIHDLIINLNKWI
jgi:hypothetical protein